jgi:cytochrome c-type biogenesis protein CcmH/NrfG
MRAKITYFITAAVLVFYFVLAGDRGVILIGNGTPVTVAFGVAVLVLPLIGAWFLVRTTQFARDAGKLSRQLEAEGGLPVDELVRTPSGRIDRDSADAVFARRKTEAEAAPGDWRAWFRLAVAYHDARDTPRARKAMQRAIRLHKAEEGRTEAPAAGTAVPAPASVPESEGARAAEAPAEPSR